MAGFYGARLIVIAIGALLVLGGLVAFLAGPAYASSGIWSLIIGVALVVGSVLERARYRSEDADRSGAPHGPGGGEPTGQPLDPRFRPTEERFEDPTTRRSMRVWADPSSGERRYVAED
jgi:hypothetical protein